MDTTDTTTEDTTPTADTTHNADGTDRTPAPADGGREAPRMGEAELRAELERVRRESARHRTQRNEARDAIAELERARDAAKAEAAKAGEATSVLEAELASLRLESAKAAAATEYGVDAALLRGQTAEELAAHAKAIAEAIAAGRDASYAPVVPGESTGPAAPTDWLRDQLTRR